MGGFLFCQETGLLLTARASTGWSHETSSVALGFNLSRFNVGLNTTRSCQGVGGGGVKEEMEKYGDTGQWNKKRIRNRSR